MGGGGGGGGAGGGGGGGAVAAPDAHASAPATSSASLRLEMRGTAPLLGDDRMAGRRGMDAVGGPILRGSSAGMLIEDSLQRDERRAGSVRDPRRGRPALIEFREPACVHRPAAQHKWLEHDQMNVRERLARAVEQRDVLLLVIMDGSVVAVVQLVPEVVHADQDTEHVRMQIDRVG